MPDLLLQDALYSVQVKDLKLARVKAQAALQAAPADIRIMDLIVKIMVAQNDASGATQAVKASAQKQPGSAAMQLYAGTYLMRQGQRQEARAALTRAKASNPELVAADFSMAQLDVLEGHLDNARTALNHVVEQQANSEEARVLLGLVEEQSGKYDVAVVHFQKVLETQPDNLVALNNLAFRLANNLDRANEALAYAQKAKELAPHNPAVDDSLGWILFKKGMYSSAVQYLQSSVSQQATPIRAYHLAMAYARLGNRSRAEQAFETGHKLDPNLPEAQTARQMLAQAN